MLPDPLLAFVHGTVLAIGLILPLGPQNAFLMSQGATHARWTRALPVVATAGVCDTLLILGGVLGVSTVVLAVPAVRGALVALGVTFLAVLAWKTWRSADAEGGTVGAVATAWPPRRQVAFALSVSLLNPHAILDTMTVIGPSSLAYAGPARVAFTVACIGVSWAWFVGMAVAGRAVGQTPAARRVLNRVSAVVIAVSALYLAASLMW